MLIKSIIIVHRVKIFSLLIYKLQIYINVFLILLVKGHKKETRIDAFINQGF